MVQKSFFKMKISHLRCSNKPFSFLHMVALTPFCTLTFLILFCHIIYFNKVCKCNEYSIEYKGNEFLLVAHQPAKTYKGCLNFLDD